MSRIYTAILLAFCLLTGAVASDQNSSDLNGFAKAEQFVHGHLYDGMLQVWAVDRRSWNQLLSVHACGGNSQQEKLAGSYAAGESLFRQSMLNLAESQKQFSLQSEQAVLNDVSQLAYRLFSASYAHGYARQVQRLENIDEGIQQELCGAADKVSMPGSVEYSESIEWQLSESNLTGHEGLIAGKVAVEQHARHGYRSFSTLLQQQYDSFDALVYSHAYQNPDAYDTLFFTVNGYQNVESYQAGVDDLSGIEVNRSQQQEIPHADFAYLVLASGYHWGTLSVLAMLEEEFPRLHVKAKSSAKAHIQKVTQAIESSDPS